jgi:hypothetical protein
LPASISYIIGISPKNLNVFISVTNERDAKCLPMFAFREQIMNKHINVRVRAKITSQNWRSDLVQIWLIRKSKTTGIASYFEDFASEVSAKDGLKLRCKNVKLFLREP